jgi:hypothetical protein
MLDKFRAENKQYNADNGLSKGDEGYRDEEVKVNILFCQERDVLEADPTTNYVVQNAEELRAEFPDYITTEYKDSKTNPSRFSKYLVSNTDSIATDSVIVECGTEYRVRTLRSFFVFVKDEPYGYNGEKAFASSILAVTRAEAPLACYTVNHGETIMGKNSDGEYVYDPRYLEGRAVHLMVVEDMEGNLVSSANIYGLSGAEPEHMYKIDGTMYIGCNFSGWLYKVEIIPQNWW